MNKIYIVLSAIFVTTAVVIGADNQQGRYYAELQNFTQAPDARMMFDEDAHQGLAAIQRDVITYKNLTPFQRFVRTTFEQCDVVLVTPETMPLLHGYVDSLCKKAHIQTPTVFITRRDGFFNAFAQKILMSSGGILIGQKLLKELSDDALEAVVAHEIGHVKHNHINKMLALSIITATALVGIMQMTSSLQAYVPDEQELLQGNVLQWLVKMSLVCTVSELLQSLIINKRFEKEADAFACNNGKARGIIEFFELILKKDQIREEEFVVISDLLAKNKAQLNSNDYYTLLGRYYMAKAGHCFTNAYKKLYYDTFYGAHPSPQARIEKAKEYLLLESLV